MPLNRRQQETCFRATQLFQHRAHLYRKQSTWHEDNFPRFGPTHLTDNYDHLEAHKSQMAQACAQASHVPHSSLTPLGVQPNAPLCKQFTTFLYNFFHTWILKNLANAIVGIGYKSAFKWY